MDIREFDEITEEWVGRFTFVDHDGNTLESVEIDHDDFSVTLDFVSPDDATNTVTLEDLRKVFCDCDPAFSVLSSLGNECMEIVYITQPDNPEPPAVATLEFSAEEDPDADA